MKKKYSVGFFIGTIFILIGLIFAYRMSYSHALEKRQVESEKEMETCYYIKNVDGYVTVYREDKKTVFEYTSIVVDELPEQIRDKLEEGIKLTSVSQVYGFLENYSS